MNYGLCLSIVLILLSFPGFPGALNTQKSPAQHKARVTGIAANELSAIRSLKAIHSSEVTFLESFGEVRIVTKRSRR